MMPSDPDSQLVCPYCQGHIQAGDVFCGHCGKDIAGSELAHENVFTLLQPALLYYFITLILLATYKFTSFFPEGYPGFVLVSVLDIGLVIAFWIYDWEQVKPLWSLRGIKWKVMLLTIVAAVAGSVLVSLLADRINVSIHDDVFYNTYLFEDTAYPLLIATLFIAVQPAIFEEVAFRGFLFNNVRQLTTAGGAVYITGFLFGIMHLAVISLLWLVPIGLAFAFLRNKYNTLWYGVIGHFVYNLSVTLGEFYGWY